MKSKIKNFLKIIILTALIGAVLCYISGILENKASLYNKAPLYALDTQPDVLFIGASRMHNGIYPTVLWRDHGIAAYNAASPGEQTGTTYYVLSYLLEDIRPKLVVFDLALVSDDAEISWSHELGFIHESMDFMPLGRKKIELAKQVADYNDMSPLAFLSNIWFYHERWKELEKKDFVPEYNRELGAELLTRVHPSKTPENIPAEYNEKALEGAGFVYLDKMMRLCDEKGIKFMFVSLPYSRDNKKRRSREYTYIQEAIRRGGYGLQMVDHLDETGLDFSTDYADSSHVNMAGACKLSDYLGEYLADNADLPDHRDDPAYAEYDAALEDYRAYKLDLAGKAADADEFAMYAYGEKDWRLEMYCAGGVPGDAFHACWADVRDCADMSGQQEQILKDKWEAGDKDLSPGKLAAFIMDALTGEVLSSGYFTLEESYGVNR